MMSHWRSISRLGLAAGFLAVAAGWNAGFAANPSALDLPPKPPGPGVSVVPEEPDAPRAPPQRTVTGNPLWAIPLSSLSATRERPIFRQSRRPPAPAIAGPPPVQPALASVPPSGPERPQLTLVGAVIGESEAIAVFLDPNNAVIRLRTGQDYSGWVLHSVKGREATLRRESQTVILALPAPGTGDGLPSPAPQPASAIATPAGPLVQPKTPGDFAPFVPRSTPKDGAPDGL
jgi:general secretion pathway protein N